MPVISSSFPDRLLKIRGTAARSSADIATNKINQSRIATSQLSPKQA
jgi:hypothetical protein